MKILLLLLTISLLLFSCKEKVSTASVQLVEAVLSDTVCVSSDSLLVELSEFEKEVHEDELFDDFVYYFSTDKALQRKRVRFPLVVSKGGEIDSIPRKGWKHDYLFSKDSFYTLIFDKDEDMDLTADLAVDTAGIEWINIVDKEIKRYSFKRERGAWYLISIVQRPLESFDNANFFSFFHHFSTDDEYQSRMIRKPLKFVTTDPDDDFSVLETTLDIDQWMAFKPEFPTAVITNIDYGQRNKTGSATKVLALKGVDNGFSNLFYFRRKSGEDWVLYKFEDTSM